MSPGRKQRLFLAPFARVPTTCFEITIFFFEFQEFYSTLSTWRENFWISLRGERREREEREEEEFCRWDLVASEYRSFWKLIKVCFVYYTKIGERGRRMAKVRFNWEIKKRMGHGSWEWKIAIVWPHAAQTRRTRNPKQICGLHSQHELFNLSTASLV